VRPGKQPFFGMLAEMDFVWTYFGEAVGILVVCMMGDVIDVRRGEERMNAKLLSTGLTM